jgi:hypothetical protein
MVSTVNLLKNIINIIFHQIESINEEEMYTPVFQDVINIINKIIAEAKDNMIATSIDL